jgi:DNA-binding transcriptional LysR family regulator
MLGDLGMLTIEYTVAVAEYRSFRRAAEALNVRQSVVSRRVRRMEDLIGVSVFERHARGLRLTNAGRVFMQDARNALALLERAIDRAGSGGRAELCQLKLGFLPPLVTGSLQSTLKICRRHSETIKYFYRPDVELELDIELTIGGNMRAPLI